MRRALSFLALMLLAGSAAGAQPAESFAMRARSRDSNKPVRVEITIERWSDAADNDRLFDILNGSDPGAFKPALAALPEIGQMRVDAYRTYPLRHARQIVAEDGSRIIRLATDIPIGFKGGDGYFRTTQDAFTLMELRLGADGKGEGNAEIGSQVRLDFERRAFGLTDPDAASVRLSSVRTD